MRSTQEDSLAEPPPLLAVRVRARVAFPERVVEKAVQRMLPKDSSLARQQFSNLRVYAGPDHKHEAQQPEVVDFKSMNSKNTRG